MRLRPPRPAPAARVEGTRPPGLLAEKIGGIAFLQLLRPALRVTAQSLALPALRGLARLALPGSHARQRSGSGRYLRQVHARQHRNPLAPPQKNRRTAAKLAPSIAWKIVKDAGYDALAVGRKIVAELQADRGLQPPNLGKALRALAAQGLVEQHGGRRLATWYERPDSRQ